MSLLDERYDGMKGAMVRRRRKLWIPGMRMTIVFYVYPIPVRFLCFNSACDSENVF